jgi:hypothetical protein
MKSSFGQTLCFLHLHTTRACNLQISVPMHSLINVGVECVDWTGGQIKNNDSSDDVKNVDLSQVHYLSGPISVEGAQPGDLLKVCFIYTHTNRL